MKVYALETSEPLHRQFETGLKDAPSIFATREIAESACKDYNEEFQDGVPAFVVEFDVVGAAGPKKKELEDLYALRHKTSKYYVTDETPEGFLDTILGWSDEVGEATGITKESELFNGDVFNIVTQLCDEDAELRPSDFELVLVETLVEPTKGQYSVAEIEQPEWFVGTIEDIEEPSASQLPKNGAND